ncbi:hypothetical protein M413DRAFT_118267 [Hebeloma cylindrosporum]|uniref:Uncharacterized protein n=1 Tax=Hebeloma cylindrosporum TaxID=76867 RepID=A0A0C3CMF8_HEBCY|nr:hypothetical protein M413DRAFT_118267 [Hebeloma cylindrosporum h7]
MPRNKNSAHGYKRSRTNEGAGYSSSFADRPYSSKGTISSAVGDDTAGIHSPSFYLDPDVTFHSEDGSYTLSNHLEPIQDLFLPNWTLYHEDGKEETNVTIDHPEHTLSPWSSSPDSVDSDLDDESPSPHEDNDHDHMYYPPSPSIYHIEESKYPAHLYTPDQQHAPLPTSPPFSPDADGWGSRGPSLFADDYSFALYDPPTTIPCSPSRRTSRELPEDDDHAANDSQRFVRLRSLPGAETDDDLIPTELASKNYIPDPSILVHTTPPRDIDGLLLWDLPKMRDVPPVRSPSPEEEEELFALDPEVFAELAGKEMGAEMQRIRELRERRIGRTESWERERFREISALLRLKMQMLGNHRDRKRPSEFDAGDGNVEERDHQGSTSTSNEVAPCVACSSDLPDLLVPDPPDATPTTSSNLPLNSTSTPTSTLASPAPTTASTSTPTSTPTSPPPAKSPSKPKITNMAQLVANMVFHRQQQDTLRRPPPIRAPRTWPGLPSSYGNTLPIPKPKTYPTPRSPLRQVSLPSDLEFQDEGEDNNDEERISASLMDSPLPLSPLVLMDSPLGLGWLTLPQ